MTNTGDGPGLQSTSLIAAVGEVGEQSTFAGEPQLLRSRGVEAVVLDDQRCSALMREFNERYPQIWDEDIGEVS